MTYSQLTDWSTPAFQSVIAHLMLTATNMRHEKPAETQTQDVLSIKQHWNTNFGKYVSSEELNYISMIMMNKKKAKLSTSDWDG